MRKSIVSVLGPVLPSGTPHGAEAVKVMKKFWTQQLDAVLPDRPDIIAVHECSDRFPEHTLEERNSYYSERGESICEFFAEKARDNNCFIAYSAVRVLKDGTRRNSTVLIGRDGKPAAVYDKNYPMVDETTVMGILPGEKETVAETDIGRIGFAICFDLNFRELAERYAARKTGIIVFSSMYHGGLMQNYWAYRCRSWFLGAVSRRESVIINPLGVKIAHSTCYRYSATAEINTDYAVIHLDYNWEKLASAKAKYGRSINIFDPGNLGSVLLTSETEEFAAADIVREFGIECLDDYYERASLHRMQYIKKEHDVNKTCKG